MECDNNPPHILLAEDDEEMRRTLASLLRANRYQVVECSDGLDLLRMFSESQIQTHAPGYSLIISDIRMPGLSGLDILEGFHSEQGFPPVILITAFGDEETHVRARESGAVAVLDKPFEVEDLLAMVSEIVDQPTQAQITHTTGTYNHPVSPILPA